MSRNLILNLGNGVYKKINKSFSNPYKKVGLNWLQLRKVKNLPENKLQRVLVSGQQIHFVSRDEFLHSLHEIFIEEIYKQKLGHHPYIIDCGANIGLSVIYLNLSFPDAEIVAFEPVDTNFSLLEKNTASFTASKITLKKEAIWNANTTLNFKSEGSLMSRIDDKGTDSVIAVKAFRLKELLNRNVDFLKIDIEGADYEVLKDIQPELHFVNNMFLEYHGTFAQNNELLEIFEIISRAGFFYYIREATDKHPTPFYRQLSPDYDVQLNIFCFRQ
jgi:FkbM family methyltransferase